MTAVGLQFQSTLPVWGATFLSTMSVSSRIFQSTLPVWGATHKTQMLSADVPHFNPRSPCGERRRTSSRRCRAQYFNPRSPCGERQATAVARSVSRIFQSTLPVWGATRNDDVRERIHGISIHAPRVGSDVGLRQLPQCLHHFNPRSPCGERLE